MFIPQLAGQQCESVTIQSRVNKENPTATLKYLRQFDYGIGEDDETSVASIFFKSFSRSKKEKKTSETVDKGRKENQERKCGFVLARTKSCYTGDFLSRLGPRSHDLVPQGLLFQFIFSFLQLKPLRRSLKTSDSVNLVIQKTKQLGLTSASALPFFLSASACPFIFNSPPKDATTGEEDLSKPSL